MTTLKLSYFLNFLWDPSFMLKSYRVVVVAYRILLSAPVPFGLVWVSNWVGLGWDWVWRDWGLMGLGLGTRA